MFTIVNVITLFGENKLKKALFRELYFYLTSGKHTHIVSGHAHFLAVNGGIGVPTGYGDPSGAAVTDVCPFSVEWGLRNGIAIWLIGP